MLIHRARRGIRALARPGAITMLRHIARLRLARAPGGPVAVAGAPRNDPLVLPAGIARDAHVPRRIFQTWKTKASLPANYAAWSASLRRAHPGWQYVLWDDADNRAFIAARFAWFLPTYDAYPREIFRVDAARLFFLYAIGGLYADLDTEALRSSAPLLTDADVVLGRMGRDPAFAHSIPNAIMAARPGAEFWLLAIALAGNAVRDLSPDAMLAAGPEALTGPVLLKRAVDLYLGDPRAAGALIATVRGRLAADQQPRPGRSRLRLLEADAWYPIDWSNPIHQRLRKAMLDRRVLLDERAKATLFPRSAMVTYWSHSW